jgi:hypothetical protein
VNQSRLGSLYEVLINVVIGFSINYVANFLIMPLYDFHITAGQSFTMGLLYTGISIARSYVIRRWFNARLHAAAMRLAAATGDRHG